MLALPLGRLLHGAVVTIAELDRLVSKTELDPLTKQALRVVRKAVMSGQATDPVLGQYTWSVEVDSPNGTARRFRFSMRRNEPPKQAD